MKKIIFCLALLFSSIALADNVYLVTVKKTQNKKARGWNLGEWLLLKQKMSIMDQWLALHSSANNFEFFIKGGQGNKYSWHHQNNSEDVVDRQKMDWFQGGAYFRIFGIEASYEHSNESYTAKKVHGALRIFGTAVQNTNITAHYGVRKFKGHGEIFLNNYWGGSATIYLLPFLSVEALYHRYLPATSSQGTRPDGKLLEYGAYIDIWFLRPGITYFQETTQLKKSTGDVSEKRTGVRIGASIYF